MRVISIIHLYSKNNTYLNFYLGGEYETLVIACTLFKKPLKIKNIKIKGESNSWSGEVELE